MSHSESAVPTGGGDEEIASALPNAEHAHDQVRHQPLADPNPDQEKLQEATEALDPASLAAGSTIDKGHQRNSEDGAEVAPLPSSSLYRQLNEETTPTTPPSLASPKGEQPVTDNTTVAVRLNIDGKDEGKDGNHSTDTVTSSIVRPIPPLHPLRTSASRKSLAARTASRSPVRTGSPSTSYIKPTPPPSPRVPQASLSPPHTGVFSSLRKSLDDAVESLPDTMVFGMSAERRRRAMTNTSALTEYEADLSSKDRTQQKIAIQKYLAQRVRADWDWQWPAAKGSDHETKPTEINVARTAHGEERWKQRDGWEDDTFTSDTEPETVNAVSPTSPTSPNSPGRIDSAISKAMSTPLTPPASKPSPFRFESPDGVGVVVKQKEKERKRRRKKLEAEEMTENDGLKCFIERRNAWTCARRVPSRSSAKSDAPKAESATSVVENGSSTAVDSEDPDNDHVESDWEYDTEVPIAPPILPVENGMRASITPSAYTTIYDKVIVQSLTPACPINLRDVLNSCVQGWQRDGEWYGPKPTVTEGLGRPLGISTKKKRRKGSLAGVLGFAPDGDLNGGTSPKSPGFGVRLKSVLGLGKVKKDELNENDDAHENGNGNVNTGTV